MMNSYHYCYYYYYCYDYDDYPSCCCCSLLLNVFLSLDEHHMLHLETSLFLRKTIQKDLKKRNNNRLLSADTARTLLPPRFLWQWISRQREPLQTHFTLHHDLLSSPGSVRTMHTIYLLLVGFFQPFWTPVSDCLLSQQDVVSNILTDMVMTLNWTTTALLHQWCPWCPAP